MLTLLDLVTGREVRWSPGGRLELWGHTFRTAGGEETYLPPAATGLSLNQQLSHQKQLTSECKVQENDLI